MVNNSTVCWDESMMLHVRDLLKAWRGKDLLDRMLQQFSQMLEDSHWMYTVAWQALFRKCKAEDIREELYVRDQQVNRLERTIRHQIVEHLSVRPEIDMPACLVLMSVTKDAERLGDYCKNLFELTLLCPKKKPLKDRHAVTLRQIAAEIDTLYTNVGNAFISSEDEDARAASEAGAGLASRCEQALQELANSKVSTRKAVVYALEARYLKRIASHLKNIASSVVQPVHAIDYAGIDEPSGE